LSGATLFSAGAFIIFVFRALTPTAQKRVHMAHVLSEWWCPVVGFSFFIVLIGFFFNFMI
jgi:hypothetical protein